MPGLGHMPIHRKLTLLATLTSAAVLLLAVLAIAAWEVHAFRSTRLHELETLAHVLGRNARSALVFDDADAAREVLEGLADQEDVDEARLWDAGGRPVAHYLARGRVALLTGAAPAPGHHQEDLRLVQVQDLEFEGEAVGRVALVGNTRDLTYRLAGFAAVACGVLLIALGLAWLLAFRLQRLVGSRIERLARAADVVAAGHDYSLRLAPDGGDEIGRLGGAFNAMLSEIQRRDDALTAARGELIDKVEQLEFEVAERRRTEEALRESKDRFRSAFEHAPVGMAINAVDGRFLEVNPALCRMLDGDETEVLASTRKRFTPPEDVAGDFDRVRLLLRDREAHYEGERQLLTCAGRRRWVYSSTAALWNPQGRVRAFITLVLDVTERHEAEERLQRSMEALETSRQQAFEQARQLEHQALELVEARDQALDAARVKSQFLANMSHELRTPLTGILGMTDVLLDTRLTDEQQEFARTVRVCAGSLLHLVNEILDFAKIEAGRLTIHEDPLELAAVLEGVADLLAPTAAQKGIELTVHPAADLPARLVGDPDRIRQVVVNLVGNAIKFTDRGGVVARIRCLRRLAGRCLVRLEVDDTGIGIPPGQQTVIFESFRQADGTTTRRHGGTGLGLTISRQLVELMGGTIGVHSEPGAGSRFWVELTLPLAPDEAPEGPVPPSLEGVHVVLADRCAPRRELIADLVAHAGADVVAAGDLREAMDVAEALRAEGRDVLVVGDSADAPAVAAEDADALRERHGAAGVPMIVVTAASTANAPDVPRLAGLALLRKPVRRSALWRAIAEARGATGSAETAPPAPRGAESESLPGLRVLLAEDNGVNRRVVRRLLERWGCVIEVAEDGEQALAALERSPFDVVLMDLQMPRVDGLEATRRWRAREATGERRVAIVALTAHAGDSDRRRCLEAGADDYLSKPFERDTLHAVLRRWWMGGGAGALPPAEPVVVGGAMPVLDRARFDEATDGDAEFARELLSSFDTYVAQTLANLAAQFGAREFTVITRVAHGIRGSAGTLGARALAEAARELEQAAEVPSPDPSAVAARLDDLGREADRLRAWIGGWEPPLERAA